MTTRRNFLKTGVALSAIGLFPSVFTHCSSAPKEKKIGLQLYSVREALEQNFDATIKGLIEIGYKRFESFGYREGKFFGRQPKELKQYLADLGAAMTSSHVGMRLLDEGPNIEQWDIWKKMCSDAADAGNKWIIIASYPTRQIQQISDVYRLAEQYNKCGEIARTFGLRFAFHNHNEEIRPKDGLVPLEVLVEQTDKNLVAFELDLSHTMRGGRLPADFIQKYPGRFPVWHATDVNKEQNAGVGLGQGVVDFESVFALTKRAGLEDYYVEQGQHDVPALQAMKMNYDFLNNAPYVKW